MQTATSYKRRRIIDAAKKEKFCTLIRESYSLEEAAEKLDVSLRTVQRERQRDEAFDGGIRSAQESHPNPLKLMESAARTHWRAAAWMLERERPERFGRRPANTARKHEVEAALDFVLEAALAATPPEQRAAFYQPVLAAVEQAFQRCFPQVDRGNCANSKKCKFPATPLADEAACQLSQEAAAASPSSTAEAVSQLSPKIVEATLGDEEPSHVTPNTTRQTNAAAITTPPPSNITLHKRSPISNTNSRSPAAQLSPKMQQATVSDTTPTEATAADPPLIALPFVTPAFPEQKQSPPSDRSLRPSGANERQRERQVAKRQKAAKKRSAASRRRNAA